MFENLRYLGGVPSVQMTDIVPDAQPEEEVDEDSRKRQDTRVSSKSRSTSNAGSFRYFVNLFGGL